MTITPDTHNHHVRDTLLIIVLVLVLLTVLHQVYFTTLYIGVLFEPDVLGYWDCDPGNDWITYLLPGVKQFARLIAIGICHW